MVMNPNQDVLENRGHEFWWCPLPLNLLKRETFSNFGTFLKINSLSWDFPNSLFTSYIGTPMLKGLLSYSFILELSLSTKVLFLSSMDSLKDLMVSSLSWGEELGGPLYVILLLLRGTTKRNTYLKKYIIQKGIAIIF